MTLGEKIRALRKERGLSAEKLGVAIKVDVATVLKWEEEVHYPTVQSLKKLASFFGFETWTDFVKDCGAKSVTDKALKDAKVNQRLKALREQGGYSKSYMNANVLKHASSSHYNQIETGSIIPSLKTQKIIADFFGVKTTDLWTSASYRRRYSPENTTVVGANIRRMREARKLSGSALAAKLGMCRATVTRWESYGKIPRSASLKAIAEVFGCGISHLLREGAR